ncbi:MAG: type III pantothenate kinase [Candidatus Izemoplasmatales bacterium]|jgi:type III pantothenate kinase
MIALIDIGNSTIAIGLSEDRENFRKIYRINTEKNKSADEYSLTLKPLLEGVERVVISSVVPELNEVFREYFYEAHRITPLFLASGIKTGIRIHADNPREVGGDLIANSVAATQIYAATCLLIDLGTATTFTYLEDMNLKGVVIAPGLTTSRNALITKTSLLPQVDLEPPTKVLGTNSTDAIKSGLIFGHAAMIDGMISRIKNKVKNPQLTVVMTGGHARLLHPFLSEKPILDEALILKGLLLIEKLNPPRLTA